MTLNDYQHDAMQLAFYPNRGEGDLTYPVLGLVGEAGEVAEKLKKKLRDGVPENWRTDMGREIGDVLWYVAAIADELGFTLADIAAMNLVKLNSRKSRDALSGSGDYR